ncbi:uncharacterized protein [Spinacia oleracea]|uniref:Aminotransferase-like plant mobile domain-containing protein n=1 Tax=Spinacia oleracea TaxID=3562 RepID=A0ABM3R3X0_SPIOL|nr:uncharacterized protein LOC130465523 [Spinacia oleracea]
MAKTRPTVVKDKEDVGVSRAKSLNPIYSTVEDPAAFITLAGLPPSAEVRIPGQEDEAKDCPEGYVVMYEYPFILGFLFPFTPLARSFVEVFNLSPSQLMPQIWRIFTVVHRVTSGWRTPFDLADLMHVYDLSLKECCRYTLVTKKKKKNLCVGLAVNDRGWQSRFVYVNKASLGEVGNFLVEGWTTEVVDTSLAGLNSDSHDKCLRFLGCSVVERSFSRDGGRLGSQEGSQVGDVDEEEAGDETICLVRRRRRLDLLEEVVANSSSASEEEFEMANTSENTLSSKPVSRMSQSEMMERARKRLRSNSNAGGQGGQAMPLVPRYSKIGASPETPVVIGGEGFHPLSSSSPPRPFQVSSTAVAATRPPAASAKKRPADKSSVEDTVITLPPNFLGDGEDAVVWPHADRLIFPSTYQRYHEVVPLSVASDAAELSLRASQAALAVRRQCSLLCDELISSKNQVAMAKKAATSWEGKWMASEKKLVDLAAAVKSKDEQLKGKDDQIADASKELERVKGELASTVEEMQGLRILYDALQEEFKDCEALAVWRTRAQMMFSCLKGEVSLWPCQKEVDDYLANGGTLEELSVPVVDADELAMEADTAGTNGADADVAPLVEDVSSVDREGEASMEQGEGDVPVVAPPEVDLADATVNVDMPPISDQVVSTPLPDEHM